MDRPRIAIFDTTLRDGEQSPGCSMNVKEKLRLAHQLDRLGVDVIEAGFPIASEGDFTAVQAIAAAVPRPIIAALARACAKDIERAAQALSGAVCPRIHVFLATSEIHLQHKLRITQQQCLEQARDSVRLAKSFCQDVEFSPEDATRTSPQFLYRILEAVIEAGATTLNIPDTVGYSIPAVANSLAAVAAGARQVECAINGIGERAGNASLEEFVMALRVRSDRYAFDTGIVSEQLFPASKLLSEITEVPVQPNKAIIGRNAFAHEAGIHQDGMLKNRLTYEIMTPQSVGVPDSTLVLGKHSGRHALGLRCEQLGYSFDRRELDDIYRQFVVLADEIKHVHDHHLLDLIRETQGSRHGAQPPALAAAAPAGLARKPFPAHLSSDYSAATLPRNTLTEHHSEQEDYLWGV